MKECSKGNRRGTHAEVCHEKGCGKQTEPFFIQAIQYNFERFVFKEKKYNPLEPGYEIYMPLRTDHILGWYDDGFYICKVNDGSGQGWHDFRTSNAKPPLTFWGKLTLLYQSIVG